MNNNTQQIDVLLVGGGIMSATLATLLHALDAQLNIHIVERLTNVAEESSDAWNNAGTGHAGYCELNYTPQNANGQIEIDRALSINAAFEVSLQFWSYLVEKNILPNPRSFIHPTPHISFVWGTDNVAFLRTRYQKLQQHPLFKDLQFSDDPATLKQWMPLVMAGRNAEEPIAATRLNYGTDVNFGTLTQHLIQALHNKTNIHLALETEVSSLKKLKNGHWKINLKNLKSKKNNTLEAKFVFLGAGGGALKLLQKSRIPESNGYGGFPVSGQWLVCNKPEIIMQHQAKVYGKAEIGAPPMSVPHLDTRMIHGKAALLFGPYAGFTTKFLKNGSYLDLAKSIKGHNLKAIVGVSRNNLDLTRYLIKESVQTHADRVATLRKYYPNAKAGDWHLKNAGKRVQIIKNCENNGGKLEFGTEIVTAEDGSIAALLGASPGASVATQTMIEVIERCFKTRVSSEQWQKTLKKIVPSYGQSLIENAPLLDQVRQHNLAMLNLQQK